MKLSRSLMRNPLGTREEKAAAQAARREVLKAHTLKVLEANGYAIGNSLCLPGSHAFQAEHMGNAVRLGVKTAADRWVAIPKVGEGMIGKVDVIAVSAFDDWYEPTAVEVWIFDAKDLLAKVKTAQAVMTAHNLRGLPFLPLSGDVDRRHEIVRATGLLSAIGQRIDSESIEWTDEEVLAASASMADAQPTELEKGHDEDAEEPLTIAEAKRRLAKSLGVHPDRIRIMVEA